METDETSEVARGTFTISIDFELIWGTLDLFGPERFRKACEAERNLIDRLLELFVRYNISATWCTLGHLFLDRCQIENGHKHPEIIAPEHAWCRDWFEHDPCGNEESAPLFYGRSLIKKISDCPVSQEIASHSFSHVIFGDAGCSRATAESEVKACIQLARDFGVELRSFAFPRNRVGHLDVLHAHGFRCYRGPEPVWHEKSWVPETVKRLARLWEVLTIQSPPTVTARMTASGLWDIPGSMIFFPMNGLRRFIPLSWRVKRALKGLHAAARHKRIFHLWFHPTNLADHAETMFLGLERILQRAAALRDQGTLDVRTMADLLTAHERNAR